MRGYLWTFLGQSAARGYKRRHF